jgi:hypothetical protein
VPEELLTANQLAKELNTSPGRLANDRARRVGIPWTRVGHSIRYRRSDVTAYLETNRVTTLDMPN